MIKQVTFHTHNIMSYDYDDEILPIVLDNGSSTVRIGFAGDDLPRVVFPNIIGDIRHIPTTSTVDDTRKESFIGDIALEHKNVLNLRYPMEHGIVTNWDDMETIWRYGLHHELGLSTVTDRPILITEAPMNPIANREKITQIFFESLQVPGKKCR